MNTSVRQLLDSFDRLPEPGRLMAAAEILRRTVSFDLPPLDDDDLTLAAEALFPELDAREAADGQA
jgi:hypothetical protein